ncbi:26S proteasome non-ATPase regulatory subunit 3 [Galdieria sulphuraria]|uniref:26S proteasome regulatory subunit N3 n=1 Tax=Galdieria sulphuraria TaxID=130081 RepID=M2W5Q6_GALSU|nr:26S proteasome regulatory subunit N3 [Galdieria sulphuraria]EME31116.1 26S proteasome regulatory subunit N3 [Galdieria sulphuraria]GJD12415.1 26S proteasome non-ATPase regulatory subunit 3 [Galdieria sulphuraria]|eukprot:XP_005707636.1 26S proteasome regulatory subunit N3 [Galdieria sulphuraria]
MATAVPMDQGNLNGMVDSTKEPNDLDSVLTGLRKNLALLEVAVLTKELRLISRVLRHFTRIRKQLNEQILYQVIQEQIQNRSSSSSALLQSLLRFLPESGSHMDENGRAMEVDVRREEKQHRKGTGESTETLLPEIIAFLYLLASAHLVDLGKKQEALDCTTKLVTYLKGFNRRTLDEISARGYYFWSLAHERTGKLRDIREALLAAHATAVLRHDYAGQAMLLNLLLRNYINYRLYDQADKLVSRTKFPATRSNNQLARYFYYLGRIRCIQLDYSDAMRCLLQALRKAPQNIALGFRTQAQKFAVLVQLLTGEVPERRIFLQEGMQKELGPYLQLARGVKNGDLHYFQQVVDNFYPFFERDGTASLVTRLRQNVIKAGLKRLTVAYSRISIEDIRKSLNLDTARDAEFIVAKAIRDGVIDAVIYHKEGYIESRESTYLYATMEPQHSFHERIRFCLDIHNETVRAMRFPENDKKDIETLEERRERLKEEQELAHTLAEEDEEDDDIL